jgi:pentose-5-phosphate-3-epimerase
VLRKERGLHFAIETDRGISRDNVDDVVNAGVEWLVAAWSIFHTVNPTDSFDELGHAASRARATRIYGPERRQSRVGGLIRQIL